MKEAEIKYCIDGSRTSIEVDGVNMSKHVSLVSISHQAGELPKAVLGLVPRSLEVLGKMKVTVDIWNLPESVRPELYYTTWKQQIDKTILIMKGQATC